jgi:hypothetical protein
LTIIIVGILLYAYKNDGKLWDKDEYYINFADCYPNCYTPPPPPTPAPAPKSTPKSPPPPCTQEDIKRGRC